ncbi:hypothetical protein [Nocardiopsis flavescens]
MDRDRGHGQAESGVAPPARGRGGGHLEAIQTALARSGPAGPAHWAGPTAPAPAVLEPVDVIGAGLPGPLPPTG